MKTTIDSNKPTYFVDLHAGQVFAHGGKVYIKNFSDDAYNATQLGGDCRWSFATDAVVKPVSEITVSL
tara:strand:+ start:23767 stop:23970 length:204 start_codon:yes stop_codon:yes gene_type:complete